MKKIVLFIFTLLAGFAQAGTWVPTGSLASNCAIFGMTETRKGDVLIFDYNASCVFKKTATSNNWTPSGLNGRKVHFLTTAPNGDIYAISGTGAYVIDAYTAFHRSTDNGETWEQIFSRPTPYSNSIGGAMVFLPDNSIIAAYPFQKGPTIGDFVTTMMCKSTNGGNSWFMTDSIQLGWPKGMIQVSPTKIFMGSTYEGIYSAPLTGKNWWPVDTTAHFFGSRYSADVIKTENGTIYSTQSRKVIRSTDNGATFQSFVTPSPASSIKSICAVSDREVYIVTVDKKLYFSKDAGESWETAMNGLPPEATITYLKVMNGKLYVSVYAYGVYYLSDNPVGVQNGNEVSKGFELKQNYPNPFNPSTKISYSIAKSSFVNITVFDLTGKEVSVLLNENKAAGNYEINFDASHLSAGIYFYKLQAEGLTQTRKMILAK